MRHKVIPCDSAWYILSQLIEIFISKNLMSKTREAKRHDKYTGSTLIK